MSTGTGTLATGCARRHSRVISADGSQAGSLVNDIGDTVRTTINRVIAEIPDYSDTPDDLPTAVRTWVERAQVAEHAAAEEARLANERGAEIARFKRVVERINELIEAADKKVYVDDLAAVIEEAGE